MKQGDRSPSVPAQFKDAAGVAVDLTGATVKFIMFDWNRVVKVNAAATAVDLLIGKVRYDWIDADVDAPGAYRSEFEATLPGGKKMTAPNDGFIHVQIVREGA